MTVQYLTMVLFTEIMMILMLDCTFLLIHWCYYFIANYIRVLSTHLETQSKRSHLSTVEILRQSSSILDLICQASNKLNQIFSVPLLLTFTSNFIVITVSAVGSIYSLNSTNVIVGNTRWMMSILFVTNWIRVLILLSAVDLPAFQVLLFLMSNKNTIVRITSFVPFSCYKIRLFREKVTQISNSGGTRKLPEKITVCLNKLRELKFHTVDISFE